MLKGSRLDRQVCRRGLVRAINDGAPSSAKVEQRVASDKVQSRQRSRRGKPEDDAIWDMEAVEVAGPQLEEEGDESNPDRDCTGDSVNDTAQRVRPSREEDVTLLASTPLIEESDFERFGQLARTNPATCKLPQEFIDRIVEFNVPEVLETYRRWSKKGYRLHILNSQDFGDVYTMLCMKLFQTETLRQISKKVTIYVDIFGMKVERVQAWGCIPSPLPEHITSRIQHFEFCEVPLLDFRPTIPHTVPAWNEIHNNNTGESTKHFDRFSGVFERHPTHPNVLKVVKIRREMNSAIFIPEHGTQYQVNDFIRYLLKRRGPLMMKQLPNPIWRASTGDKEAD